MAFTARAQNPAQPLIYLSQDLLYAVRTDDNCQPLLDSLAKADENKLAAELKTDADKLGFWLNIYNASVQLQLKKDPKLWEKRSAFYGSPTIKIAGTSLSLDEIEHGILRHSKMKLALGYFNHLFVSRFEKRFRVEQVDPRIHFALNCGASSCPAIAFYDPAKINEQLDLACKVYLSSDCKFDKEKNTVEVPKLFSWFRGDFGGKRGIRKMLIKYEIIPAGSKPKLIFKPYNWDLELGKYSH